MALDRTTDAIDQILDDLHHWWPEMEVIGLPITGRVLRLAVFLQGRREERLAEFGLTVADFDVLATLRRRAGEGALNVRDVQHATMLSSSGITKRLDRLERSGLIARQADPADRRGVLIKLTPAGLRLIDDAVPAVTASETELVRDALGSERERRQVEAGLRRLLVAQESRAAT